MAPPPNDDFANAQVLAGRAGAVPPIDVTDATIEVDEPVPTASGQIFQSIWFKWIAPATAHVTVNTIGSLQDDDDFLDTVLAVYTGTSFADMVEVVSNDDMGLDRNSVVAFDAAGGTTYWIQAGTFNDATPGAIRVGYEQALGDMFASPIVLPGDASGAIAVWLTEAYTEEIGEPAGTATYVAWRTRWFDVTPAVSGRVNLIATGHDYIGGDIMPTVTVWTGATLGTLVEVVSEQGVGSPLELSFAAVGGTTYRIQVQPSPDASGGYIALEWTAPVVARVWPDQPWRIFVTDINARTLSILDHRVTGRQFMFVLNGPATHTGQVGADDTEINLPFPTDDDPALLSTNVRLLYALRREPTADPPYVCRFGGIVMQAEDQGADAPTTRYTAYDPWQYMFNRPARNPDTGALLTSDGYVYPAGTRASQIATDMLGTTAFVDGETFIDTTDAGLIEPTDPLADPFTIEAGTSVGEVWQSLCATGTIDILLLPMYEPITAPGKVCRFHTTPFAGILRADAVMAWDGPGHSVMGISRLVDGTRLANRVQYFAGQGGAPVPLQSDAASIAKYGEYWAQQFFPGSGNKGLVELAALAELQIRRNGARNISFDPAPERTELPLRDYALGDYLPVWASRNLREPLGVDYASFDPDFPGASGYQRVYAIPIELDDNGVALVRGIVTSKEN